MNTLVIDGKSLSVECCLDHVETKMCRDVKLLYMYDIIVDTNGYIQVKMSAASSLHLARIHARFTHCKRASQDYKLTSLGASQGIIYIMKIMWKDF